MDCSPRKDEGFCEVNRTMKMFCDGVTDCSDGSDEFHFLILSVMPTDACTPLFIWWGGSKMLDFREKYLKHQFINRKYIDAPYDSHFHKSCSTLK